ncbi:MAG TPA: flagellar biosynthetic protein FliR [Oxalicibacterium sp.]|jgi:flagellar biosynthetic protein FliR|nr:flagellar biosynthetic protein FliR [Oxalicibacterium sp.]
MITLTSAELNTWIASVIWPLTRILGVIAVAPLFGNVSVPARVKISLAILLSLIVAPTVPALPATDPMSAAGLLILTQQLVIGLTMGFAVRVVFAGVELAGEISGMTMGLGFASFFDPQTQARTSAISQFLALIMIMVYMASDLHLLVLSTLAKSFELMPISASAIGNGGLLQIVKLGGRIFSAGVQLSMPIVAALLITNVALGILTRAAPQLNIFGVGFPVTIGVGLIMIGVVLPYLTMPMINLLQEGIDAMGRVATAYAPLPAP